MLLLLLGRGMVWLQLQSMGSYSGWLHIANILFFVSIGLCVQIVYADMLLSLCLLECTEQRLTC